MEQRGMGYRFVRFVVLWAVMAVGIRLGTSMIGSGLGWSDTAMLCVALLLPTLPPERIYRVRRPKGLRGDGSDDTSA